MRWTRMPRVSGAPSSEAISVVSGARSTVPIDPRAKPDKMTILPVSGLLADTIMNVFADDSVSAIFGGENQLF